MAPPAYGGTSGLFNSSLLHAAIASARPTAANKTRGFVIGAPLERIAERHPEEVRVEVVQAMVQQRGRRLVEQRLARAAAPGVLLDILIGQVPGEAGPELYRRAQGELVAGALGEQRRHGLGWRGSFVVQVAAPERPLGIPHPLGAEPK